MNNLFSFEYTEANIANLDMTPSRFGIVYGDNGPVIHTKKDSYTIVKTEDFSMIGNAFIDKGYKVSTFSHKHGEVIGLNIALGDYADKVGDKHLSAHITLPNNGGGVGFLSLKEDRLVCSNGMVRTLSQYKVKGIKIPHTIGYPQAIELMTQALGSIDLIRQSMIEFDTKLDSIEVENYQVMIELNKWFYENELPLNWKPKSLEEFRMIVSGDYSDFKFAERYDELKLALERELEYNTQLGLNLSAYTAYAAAVNYLSRRTEKSKTTAPAEIKVQRESEKLQYFIELYA